MKKLAIVPFRSWKGNHYIYDDCTGAIIPSTPLLELALKIHAEKSLEDVYKELLLQYNDQDVQAACHFIRVWEDSFSAFYRKPEWTAEHYPYLHGYPQAEIRNFSQSNVMQLLLVLTESCNLRCKYCIYSDHYPNTRTYTPKHMSLEVARQAVDYFFSLVKPLIRRNPGKQVAITFYGGEPLMEINLLRQLVPYINNNAPCEVMFNITTNVTLLDDKAIDFLLEHGFNVALSLDGPQKEHDRNRVFPGQAGSFDKVWKNVQLLKRRKTDRARLMYVNVYDWKTDLQAVEKFFAEEVDDLVASGFANPVSGTGSDYYQQFTQDDYEKHKSQKEILWAKYTESLMHGTSISSYMKCLFDLSLISVHIRSRQNDPHFPPFPVGSSCIPGMKIAVRPDGIIDICERVNGTLPIGHVQTGIDFDRVGQVIDEYNLKVTENCFDCPITRLCGLCFAISNSDQSFEIPPGYCASNQEQNVRYLETYCSALEENKEAFARLDQTILTNWVLNK